MDDSDEYVKDYSISSQDDSISDIFRSPYQSDESDTVTTSRHDQQIRPQTPECKNAENVASEPPSTLRRSTRRPVPVKRLEATMLARPEPSQAARGSSRPGSHDHTVQALLKLPGFYFTRANNVFNSRDGAHLATVLGAQYEPGGHHRRALPASDQRAVCLRVANVIEACCDEWLEEWQGKALTSDFWTEAAERLRCYNKTWAAINPTPVQVNMICMAYTGHWDKNGRGNAPEEGWGFELGELTWGRTKAEIDPDLFAKPWEYERASCADESIRAENAARDFFEYVNETETEFGHIQNAIGARNNDRNRPTNRRRGGRSLVAPSEAPEGSGARAVAMNQPHQFIVRDKGDPVIVCGPRQTNNVKGEGTVAGRIRATIDRSNPNRLLVTFSNLDFLGNGDGAEEKRVVRQGDEGKDVCAMDVDRQGSEDVTLRSTTEEVEASSLFEEIL